MSKKKESKKPIVRNKIFVDLRTPKYRKRVMVNKKGKASYNRREKNPGDFFMEKPINSIIFLPQIGEYYDRIHITRLCYGRFFFRI